MTRGSWQSRPEDPDVPARRAGTADLPEIVRLVSIMFADLGTRADPSWQARTIQALSSRLWTDVGAFVVDAQPAPVLAACAVGVLHRSLPSPRRTTQTVGYIEWVVADPARRRQGHASAATEALVDWLTDQGAAVVDVHASAAAEPLYRRLGFTADGPVALRRPTRHRLP
jgi:GNAT superfamily N-acetyltransferase